MKSFKVKCLQGCKRHVYLSYISPTKRFNLLPMRTSQYNMVDNFHKNACGGHIVFQNEANFSPREAYLLMKIFSKFGEASWCSFPLRVLTSKISLHTAAAVAA